MWGTVSTSRMRPSRSRTCLPSLTDTSSATRRGLWCASRPEMPAKSQTLIQGCSVWYKTACLCTPRPLIGRPVSPYR
eukprot:00439_4